MNEDLDTDQMVLLEKVEFPVKYSNKFNKGLIEMSCMSYADKEEAIAHGFRALKIFKATVGIDHIGVANTYNNLAILSKEANDEEKYLIFTERGVLFNHKLRLFFILVKLFSLHC